MCSVKQLLNVALDRYGTIVSVKAVVDHATNQCKGYGFVLFEKAGSAQRAVAAMKEKDIACSFAKVCRGWGWVEWRNATLVRCWLFAFVVIAIWESHEVHGEQVVRELAVY